MYKRISYTLTTRDRAFPGAPTMHIQPFKKKKKGDLLNTYQVTLFNHFGTHMDGPNHFNGNGRQLYEMELSRFIFERPLLIDIPKGEGEKVLAEDLLPYGEKIKEADLLLIRSGFGGMRQTDSKVYSERGPAVSSQAARYLVDHFPALKAIGMDWISLATPLDMEDGIRAHQILLGAEGDGPILIIEDLDLRGLEDERLERVYALPLFVEGIDSAPVTVVAKIMG